MLCHEARELLTAAIGPADGIESQPIFCDQVLTTLVNDYHESLLDMEVVKVAAQYGVLITGDYNYYKANQVFDVSALLLPDGEIRPKWLVSAAADKVSIDQDAFLHAFADYHGLKLRGGVIVKNGQPLTAKSLPG